MAATVRELAARPEQMVRTETRMQCSAQLIALALVRAEIKSCGPSRSHQRSSSSAAPPSSPSMDDHVHVIWALPMAMPIDLPPYLSTVHVHDDGIRSNRRTTEPPLTELGPRPRRVAVYGARRGTSTTHSHPVDRPPPPSPAPHLYVNLYVC